jgi:hypothetical protein
MRTLFDKCASWKSSEIPSKMRTFFQDAHENCAPSRGERFGPERGPSGEAGPVSAAAQLAIVRADRASSCPRQTPSSRNALVSLRRSGAGIEFRRRRGR